MPPLVDRALLQLGVAVSLTLVATMLLLGSNGYLTQRTNDLDAQADWLVANAVVDGTNPYQSLDDLADRFDVDYDFTFGDQLGPDQIAPRTPGAVLLSLPLALVEFDQVRIVAVVGSFLALGWASVLVAKTSRRPIVVAVVTILVLTIARPHLWSLRFATQSPILAIAAAGLLRAKTKDDPLAGILLGWAITLKLFPALLIVPLIKHRRWRTAGIAALTALGLNLGGLLLPSVGLRDALSAVLGGSNAFFSLSGNSSAGRALSDALAINPQTAVFLAIGIGAVATYLSTRRDRLLTFDLLGIASIAVLMSPLAWTHYRLMVLPLLIASLLTLRPVPMITLGIAALAHFGDVTVARGQETTVLVLTAIFALLVAPVLQRRNSRAWRSDAATA